MKNIAMSLASVAILLGMIACSGCLSDRCRDGQSFKLMSFNVHHCEGSDGKLDFERVARTISTERPRFVALQELDTCAKRSGFINGPAELARLTGMHATFAQAIPFEMGGYGIAILSCEKPVSVKELPLPGREPRILLMAEFDDCWVGCTHLDLSAEKRMESLPVLKDALSGTDKPVFLCGDWNAFPDSELVAGISSFAKVISLTETSTFHGMNKDSGKWRASKSRGKCIDYIAVDAAHAGSVEVSAARTVEDRISSDHAPVTVIVDVR